MTERKILEQHIKDHQEAIDKAKAEIAALDNPKPRHGDYGLRPNESGDMKLRLFTIPDKKHPSAVTHHYYNGTAGCEADEKERYNIFGNIFDDLTELAKPLDEFKADYEHVSPPQKLHVRIDEDRIWFMLCGNNFTVSMNKAKEISMKLRRVIRTAEDAT